MEIVKADQNPVLVGSALIDHLRINFEEAKEQAVKTKANTFKTRSLAAKAFNNFCWRTGETKVFTISNTDIILNAPISPEMMATFIYYLRSDQIRMEAEPEKELPPYGLNTIHTWAGCISGICKSNDYASPLTGKVKQALSYLGEKGGKQAESISEAHLCDVVSTIDTSTNLGKRDKAILLLCFDGAFRRSELVSIECNESKEAPLYIELKDSGLRIHVQKHKGKKDENDNFYKFIPSNRKNLEVCTVHAVRQWLEASQNQNHLFSTVHKRTDKVHTTALAGNSIDRIIKQYFGSDYSAHSMRVGFTIASFMAKVSKERIMRYCGWKTDAMFMRYTKQADAEENTPVRSLNRFKEIGLKRVN